jgi:hypothetical protein
MKHILITTISILLISNSIFAQLKIKNKDFKTEKVKGIITLMEKTEYISKQDSSHAKIVGIGAATIVGTLLPYAFKYGNSALKSATTKKPKDYVFESEALNAQSIDFKELDSNFAFIKVGNSFYKKGESEKQELATYKFDFSKEGSLLKIKLYEHKETYTPVKIKRNYDLIISSFDISISAITIQHLGDSLFQEKVVELGTARIYKVNQGFLSKTEELVNETQMLLPTKTEKGENIEISQLIVKIKIKHINPQGTTNSYLNEFLVNNSDTNEALLNSIFIEKAEGE